ncbi:MAG: glycine cleavage system aminomethyltransferase GcvT [Rhodobacteraceae bacterium]|nr:glycine cleavage system aminomethyltransferase GcvT [Paracoccaceae bacterium]
MDNLLRTPLYDLHTQCGAKMVPFAGHSMPLYFAGGALKEHRATRLSAGLFDVSHMGQVIVRPVEGGKARTARLLEGLMPIEIENLPAGRQRYALLTDSQGCILDDLIVASREDHYLLVVNAATKQSDVDHLKDSLGGACEVSLLEDRAMLALQGPKAESALRAAVDGVPNMRFMDCVTIPSPFGELWLARSGYTGEDGFEVSVPNRHARELARTLLAQEEVIPVGLAARDSLRLEAGYSLYGADIDTTTTVVEAGLAWSVGRSRRKGGSKEGGFPGSDVILRQMAGGTRRRMVGLQPQGRLIARAGFRIFDDNVGAAQVGVVTSGGFGATINRPVALGYVDAGSLSCTTLHFEARGRFHGIKIVPRQSIAPNLNKG